jgi:hypothetical protein
MIHRSPTTSNQIQPNPTKSNLKIKTKMNTASLSPFGGEQAATGWQPMGQGGRSALLVDWVGQPGKNSAFAIKTC